MTQPPPHSGPDDEGFDRVVAEIMAETERRRASGVYPAEMLERLDAEFDRFAPLSFRRTGVEGAIRAVESASFINVDVPVDASRRAARAVKAAVKKSTGWYHLHVARQITSLGIQITRPLRMLHEGLESLSRRVSDLEDSIDQRSDEVAAMVDAASSHPLSTDAISAIVELVGNRGGRVVHLGAQDVDLVRSLVDAGVDAYGITRRGGGGLELEIRAESVLGHLRDLDVASVSGAIVTGIPDSGTTRERVELCRLLAEKVVPGGRIVIVTVDRDRWISDVGPIAADLAASGPLHTDTWLHLLDHFGARAPHVEATVDANRIIGASAS